MSVSWPFGSKQPAARRPRMAERHQAHGLHCALGELVDLSTGGMRVKGNGKVPVSVGQVLPLMLSNSSQSIRVLCEVRWLKKPMLGKGPFEIGVKFVEMRPGLMRAVEQFAKFGCINLNAQGEGETEKATPAANSTKGSAAPRTSESTQHQQHHQPAPTTVEVENLYLNLGVSMDATQDELRRAFHAMALKYHPDRCTDEDAAEKFAAINKSYMVLKDPETRRRYDELLRRSA